MIFELNVLIFLKNKIALIFFLGMDFILKKAHYASFNTLFRKEILQIALKCEDINEMSLDFIDELEQLDFLQKEEELAENEIKKLEEIFKANMVGFLICEQLWQRFGEEFNFLDTHTLKFAIIFETKKSKSLLKEIEKLIFASKSYSFIKDIFIIMTIFF